MENTQKYDFFAVQRNTILRQIDSAPLWDIPTILSSVELYDNQSAQSIIEKIRKEINNDNKVDNLIKPIVCSVVDGVFELVPVKPRKIGLTSQRIVDDVWNFSYDSSNSMMNTMGDYSKYLNSKDEATAIGEKYASDNRPEYDRSEYEDKGKLEDYKEKKFAEGKKNTLNEYSGEDNITRYKNNPDFRRNDPTHRYQAQVDHIVPLESIYNDFKDNYALSNSDIKRIANIEENYAITNAGINQQKGSKTNEEYVKEHPELPDNEKKELLKKSKEAHEAINKKSNETVAKNLLCNVSIELEEYSEKYKKKNGKLPSAEELEKVKQELKSKKTKQTQIIWDNAAKGAGKETVNCLIGDIIVLALKPIVYEIKDCFSNGICGKLPVSNKKAAFHFRLNRAKGYIWNNVKKIQNIGEEIFKLLKNFVSSLFDCIIQLFVGFIKNLLKIIKEGFTIFVRSFEILSNPNYSTAQKGNAIIKVIGGSIFSLVGIGLDALFDYFKFPPLISRMLSTMISGILSAVFMYALDKLDLFDEKTEKYIERINEIFDMRIADINLAARTMEEEVMLKIRNKKKITESLISDTMNAISDGDSERIAQCVMKMATFFNIVLPYNSLESFVKWFDEQESIDFKSLAFSDKAAYKVAAC